ncbi:MAG TPA: hypothetical protein VGW57_10670 [Chthoniobacterales bacterium]|nr:hypothetical protein [Chthoniobacterales bacterium]
MAAFIGTGVVAAHWDSIDQVRPVNEPGPEKIVEAKSKLDRARAYKEVRSYDEAQKEIIGALTVLIDDPASRQAAVTLWKEVEQARRSHPDAAAATAKRKHVAELEEAHRLAEEGNTAEAATKAGQVLAQSNDEEIVAQARKILAENHPTALGLINSSLRDFFKSILVWFLTAVQALALLGALYLFLRLLRFAISRWSQRAKSRSKDKGKEVWQLTALDDKTNSNIGDLVISSFARWKNQRPKPSSGLLKLGMVQLPTVPSIETPERPELDPTQLLESVQLQVGSLTVGGVAKALSAIRAWLHSSKPSIVGSAFKQETQIVVHLAKRSDSSSTVSVDGIAAAAAPEKAADAATYKMYYLLANKEKTVSDADLANKLREGLDQLSQYLSGRDPQQLEVAYHTIREVVQEKPTDDEACLFEGVALDLLERHDEASSRFAYLAENAEDEKLRTKAKYNEAVSLFRKYRPEDLEIAITKLDEIVGKSPDLEALVGDPIKALASAAKANAIAHRFIFWRKTLENRTQEEQRATIEGWTNEMGELLDQLRRLLETVKGSDKAGEWDPLLLRQLQWAIDNARGNAHLNLAMHVFSDLTLSRDALGKRSASLKTALNAFRRCEVLLPAGVETLTNIATTLLLLDKREESRRYAQRAIELNKNYEYAYYRLTQSWIDENRADEAVKVLNNFPRAPQIPGFKELFNRYYVQPKSA